MIENKEGFGSVTVIMPVYNGELFVEAAVRSVMSQTYKNWNLVVIDDGSADSTCSVVQRLALEDPRITLVRNGGKKGAAGARNFGLEQCSGDYAAFLDCDDVWDARKLELQLQRMREKNVPMSYTSYAIMDDVGCKKSDYIVSEKTTFEEMLRENVVGCSTVILSKELYRKYRFSTDFYHEDYCLWLRILLDGYEAAGCSQVLTGWRLLSASRSYDKKNSARNRWKIYREYLHLPFLKSVQVFLMYMINGVRKYSNI